MDGTRRQCLRAGLLVLVGSIFRLRASATQQESRYPSIEFETNVEAKKLTLTIHDPHKDLTGLRLVYASYTEKGKDQVLLKQRGTSISTDKHKFSFEMDAPVSPSTFEFEIELGNLDLSSQFEYSVVPWSQSSTGKWIPLD
jgi:hypothetical protein